jgi:hypothetical protein
MIKTHPEEIHGGSDTRCEDQTGYQDIENDEALLAIFHTLQPFIAPLSLMKDLTPTPAWRLCRNAVHGSRASPRTEYGMLKINHLAVRPERVEGRMANYDTVS